MLTLMGPPEPGCEEEDCRNSADKKNQNKWSFRFFDTAFRSASLEFSNPAVENRMGVRVSVRPTSVGVRCGPSDVVHFHFLEFGTVWFDQIDVRIMRHIRAENLHVRLNN